MNVNHKRLCRRKKKYKKKARKKEYPYSFCVHAVEDHVYFFIFRFHIFCKKIKINSKDISIYGDYLINIKATKNRCYGQKPL